MKIARRNLICAAVALSMLPWGGQRAWGTIKVVSYNIDLDTTDFSGNWDSNGVPMGLTTIVLGMGQHQEQVPANAATGFAGVAQPVDVIAFTELANATGTPKLSPSLSAIASELTTAAAAAGETNVTYSYDTYNDPTTGGTGGGPSGIVYRTQTVQVVGTGVGVGGDSGSGAPREPIRYQLRPVGYAATNANADFYLYLDHAKALDDSTSQMRRGVEAAQVRANADALPANSKIIYAGDWNTDNGSTDPGYTGLVTTAGNGQAWDPDAGWDQQPNPPGPTKIRADETDTATSLGSRLDYELVSNAVNPANHVAGMEMLTSTYQAFGNDGSVTNVSKSKTALSDLSNAATILTDLTVVTDHLPVVADYDFVFSDSWNLSGGGAWGTAANWAGQTVPSGAGSTATLAKVGGSGTLTVHLDGEHALGQMVFGNAAGTAAEGWVVDNNGSANDVLILQGTAAPTVTVDALGSGKTAAISAMIAGSQGLTKMGVGTLVLSGSNIYTGGTIVNGGMLTFATASARPLNDKLTINKDATTGTGTMVVIGGASGSIDSYRTALAGSFTKVSGVYKWTNGGTIGSTDAALAGNANEGIGYMTGANYLAINPTATGIAAGDVVLNYTYMGDVNLDGSITASDYAAIDAGFLLHTADPTWINGDFNYDGVVNAADYALIDAAYAGQGSPLANGEIAMHASEFGAAYLTALQGDESSVPEPGTLGLMGLGVVGLLRRGRRGKHGDGAKG